MKRIAALLSLIVIIGGGLIIFWPHGDSQTGSNQPAGGSQAPTQQNGAPPVNQNPHPLTDAEQTAFLPLVCAEATGAGGGFAHQCNALPGYPSQDYGGAGLGLGITLQSVIYGHFTSADEADAYVTYAGSFEPHVNNFGGGLLFTGGPGAWKLKAWHPGGQAGNCVSLNPTGTAKFVCLYEYDAQGEEDSLLSVTSLPPPSGQKSAILSASDLRGTVNSNGNCNNLPSGDAVLISIDHLSPAPGGATAGISYVSASDAKSACAAKNFANAPVKTATLKLKWNGSKLSISPDMSFAPAS